MKIHTIWGKIKDPNNDSISYEPLHAITEAQLVVDPEEWEELKNSTKKEYGPNLIAWREAIIEVDETRIESMFELPNLTKPKITNPLNYPPGVRGGSI